MMMPDPSSFRPGGWTPPHQSRAHRRPSGFGPAFGPSMGFGPDWPFGPRGAGRARARRGDVRAAILALLADAPRSGYALIQDIEHRSEGAWRPSPGSVYPTLQQLVDEGLIEATSDNGRNEYRITDSGRAWVDAHPDEVARAWEIPGAGRHERDESRAYREAVAKLARVVAQFPLDATPEQRAAAVTKIDELRRALYALLAE